jgi:hypothetical protein
MSDGTRMTDGMRMSDGTRMTDGMRRADRMKLADGMRTDGMSFLLWLVVEVSQFF